MGALKKSHIFKIIIVLVVVVLGIGYYYRYNLFGEKYIYREDLGYLQSGDYSNFYKKLFPSGDIVYAKIINYDKLILNGFKTKLSGYEYEIDDIARVGDTIVVDGDGFGKDPIVIWEYGNHVRKIPIKNHSDTQIDFIVPNGVSHGFIRVFNGEMLSNPLEVRLVNNDHPVIFPVDKDSMKVEPEKTFIVKGVNLRGGYGAVYGVFDQILSPAIFVNDNEAKFKAPGNQFSFLFRIKNNSGISNTIAYAVVRKGVSGIVKLPTNSKLSYSDLFVSGFLGCKVDIANDGTFSGLTVSNQKETSIHVFTKEKENPAMLLSAVIFDTQSNVEISPESTAVDLTHPLIPFTPEKNYRKKHIELLSKSTAEFATFLDAKLGVNPHYLDDFGQNKEYGDLLTKIMKKTNQVMKKAYENGEIKSAAPSESSKREKENKLINRFRRWISKT